MEQRREQRAGADHVAGRDLDGVGVRCNGGIDEVGEVLRPAAVVPRGLVRRAGFRQARIERPVEIVEGKDLNIYIAGWLCLSCRK